MAQVTDLTFEAINEAAIADPSIGVEILTLTGDVINLNVKALTGDSYTALDNNGVLEMMFKIRKLCTEAQSTVNENDATNASEELNSFPNFSYGIPSSDGYVEVTQTQAMKLPINANTIVGVN
jgi:hypothetical protein